MNWLPWPSSFWSLPLVNLPGFKFLVLRKSFSSDREGPGCQSPVKERERERETDRERDREIARERDRESDIERESERERERDREIERER